MNKILAGILALLYSSLHADEIKSHFPEKLPDSIFAGKPCLITVAPEYQKYFLTPALTEANQGAGTARNPFKTYASEIYSEKKFIKFNNNFNDIKKITESKDAIESANAFALRYWLYTETPYQEILENYTPNHP